MDAASFCEQKQKLKSRLGSVKRVERASEEGICPCVPALGLSQSNSHWKPPVLHIARLFAALLSGAIKPGTRVLIAAPKSRGARQGSREQLAVEQGQISGVFGTLIFGCHLSES